MIPVGDQGAAADANDGDGCASRGNQVSPSRPGQDDTDSRPEHVVQFYESEAFLLDSLTDFCRDAVAAGETAVVFASAERLSTLEQRLATAPDKGAAGAFIGIDAEDALARVMVDGAVDRERHETVFGDVVCRAAANGRGVRVYGEMAALLVERGNLEGARELEALANELQLAAPMSLLCPYRIDAFSDDSAEASFADICAAHDRVLPGESFLVRPAEEERLREVALLQLKARRLEAEIARRERAEEQMRAALHEAETARLDAETALHVRDQFLAAAAHEMCNPLAGLSLHTQVALKRLERGQHLEPERIGHVLHAISGQTTRLARLVERLLDVTRLEAGALALERQAIDVSELVVQAVETARGWSARHIVIDAPDALPAHVDPARFSQLLANLLENAITFSHDDDPIEVALAASGENLAYLTVRDHGPGIAPESRERLFERFYHPRSGSLAHGLGLGLYISREIVDLHGGQIHAEFPDDGGSRFVVSFPLIPEVAGEPVVPA
ncbi:MAG: MEDS domain-containing protein [Thermomicrobiales bacterium]|nr:MEDS domain-containing protein [Thermomicrobiales bacterium]